jgi:hypothetical protein
MSDLPERDPLADLVSRSVGARIESVAVEELPSEGGVERKRLRYETAAGPRSAIFERRARGVTLEAQLLPFLARKTPHVPQVYSRGLPPPHAALGPWLLLEDVLASPNETDAAAIVRAKRAIEVAVANDVPALRALGLRGDGRTLVHGSLTIEKAHRTERGVVIVDWSNAYLGDAEADVRTINAPSRSDGRGGESR